MLLDEAAYGTVEMKGQARSRSRARPCITHPPCAGFMTQGTNITLHATFSMECKGRGYHHLGQFMCISQADRFEADAIYKF